MKSIFLSIFFFASFSQAQLLPEIDAAELRFLVEEISGERDIYIDGQRTRISERGSQKGRFKSAKYLKQRYEEIGLNTELQEFGNYRKGVNIVASKPGRVGDKTFIVSSHFDSVHNAGADDDGTGTMAAFAIAKALKEVQLRSNLLFIGFDLEESGSRGAKAYVKHLQENDKMNSIAGVIQLEMMGYDGDNDGAFHVIDCGRDESVGLANSIMNMIDLHELPLTRSPACTAASDHAIFWRAGRPAIVISENFFGGDKNPCYHRSCDKTDILNFEYMANIVRATTLAVVDLAGL